MLVTFVLAGALIAFALWAVIEAAAALGDTMRILNGEAGQGRDVSEAGDPFSRGFWWAIASVGSAFAAGVIL